MVVEYGGYVDKFIGDNVMAIFGAPVAHGDDAERAVRAGLAMQAVMGEMNEPIGQRHGVTFELCVGINTGEVLAGHDPDGSYTVIGDSVNVAARLQAAARPGSVTVGESTYRATRGVIDYGALERPLTLKGKAEPVPAWEALAPEAPSRHRHRRGLPWSAAPRSSPSCTTCSAASNDGAGRIWRPSSANRGSASRGSLRQFEQELQGRAASAVVQAGRCLPYGSGIVYWPLGEVIRAECAIVDGDPPAGGVEEALGADGRSCWERRSPTAAPRPPRQP